MTTVAKTKSKQAQAQREKTHPTFLYRVDGKPEEDRQIHRVNIRKSSIKFAIKLLLDEIRAYYFGAEGGE